MEILGIVLLAGFVGVAAYAIKNSGRTKDQWTACAAELGLDFAPGPHSHRPVHARRHLPEMFGQHDGQDIYVGVRTYTTGSGKNSQTHYFTYVDVVFDPQLKRGVNARRADAVSKLFGDVFGQRDIQLGSPELDRELRIDGLDPEQVRGLFGVGGIAARLLARHDPFVPHVTDGHVRLEARGVLARPEQVRPAIAPAVALYRAVLAAWRALPPSVEEARLEPTWRRVAERLGLAYEPRGMRACGRSGEVGARFELVIHDRGWATELAATFDPPLGVGFRIAREGVLAGIGKLFGAQDIKLGDAAFDAAFVVKGKDEQRVREILVDDARAGLLELARAGELIVDDGTVLLRLPRIVDDELELRELLGKLTTTANQMVKHRRIAPVGPYR
jgi:hypothetical protein